MDIKELLNFWSPWWSDDEKRLDRWRGDIPAFKRPVYYDLRTDLHQINQIISITGPRRVGKSTILKQIVKYLLDDEKVEPSRVIYFSFDDPALYLHNVSGAEVIEQLMEYSLEKSGDGEPVYLLLDEIQALDRWELFLKKYYDLNYPVRVLVSGSASSPIFKGSRESLTGRVKDYHLLPFSFREYVLFLISEMGRKGLFAEMDVFFGCGEQLKGMFAKSPEHVNLDSVGVPQISDDLWDLTQTAFATYVVEGGFPEVWNMPSAEKKIEYLYDNQIKKVITEDLVLATEFRKPEQLKTFYVSLLEKPGREVGMTTLSKEIGINVQQIEKFLPLLEMTDLIRHADKFRKSTTRVRRGNQKFYPVDMALRNAVLRIGPDVLEDRSMMGLYAEALVFNALKKWRGVLAIDYHRERNKEVDFIVHTNPSRFLPIEVKYRSRWDLRDIGEIFRFYEKYSCHIPAIITKDRDDFGFAKTTMGDLFKIPLVVFLLLFD